MLMVLMAGGFEHLRWGAGQSVALEIFLQKISLTTERNSQCQEKEDHFQKE